MDSLLRPAQLTQPEPFYPLHLLRCERCGMVQIDYAVDPAELFYEGYPYMTGITGALKSNFDAMAGKVIETLGLQPGSLVIDIGSNDGTILEGFKARGMRVLGVEPTGIAKIANSKGIPTLQAFFSEDVARDILKKEGPASLITAANVFAHVANLGPCLRGIHALLGDHGTFISESHYLLDLIDTCNMTGLGHTFEALAARILDEKTAKFTETNRARLDELLGPFRDRLKEFQKKVEDSHIAEVAGRGELKAQLETLRQLNQQIGEDARNLTTALKGEAKTQGTWGEMILERTLELSGLVKGREYDVQVSSAGEEGNRLQPDVVIHLPDDRHLVIDSKGSLKAFERYASADDADEREAALAAHLQSRDASPR